MLIPEALSDLGALALLYFLLFLSHMLGNLSHISLMKGMTYLLPTRKNGN